MIDVATFPTPHEAYGLCAAGLPQFKAAGLAVAFDLTAHTFYRVSPKNLEKLEKLDELDGLEKLDRLDRLEKLDELDKLEKLDELDRLDKLDGLDRLDKLDGLDGGSSLQRPCCGHSTCPPTPFIG